MKHILLILLVMNLGVNAQSRSIFKIEIKQNLTGTFTKQIVFLKNDKICLHEERITEKGKIVKKKLFNGRVDKEKIDSLKSYSAFLMDLKNDYVEPVLGGNNWSVTIYLNKKIKKITIVNVTVPEISELFAFINQFTIENFLTNTI